MRGTQLRQHLIDRPVTPSLPHRFVEEVQIPRLAVGHTFSVRHLRSAELPIRHTLPQRDVGQYVAHSPAVAEVGIKLAVKLLHDGRQLSPGREHLIQELIARGHTTSHLWQ